MSRTCADLRAELGRFFPRLTFDLHELDDGRWEHYFSSRFIANTQSYLIVRVALFFVIFAIFCWSIVASSLNAHIRCWPIFLTNQGLFIELVYLLLAAKTTKAAISSPSPALPWHGKAAWVLQGIALPASFMIFALYWLLVFDGSLNPISPFTHGVNFLVMVVDQVLASTPVYLVHSLFFMAFAAMYMVWTAIHFASGLKDCDNNRFIYGALDWSKFDKTATLAALVLLVAAPLVCFVFWRCCYRRTLETDTEKGDLEMTRPEQQQQQQPVDNSRVAPSTTVPTSSPPSRLPRDII